MTGVSPMELLGGDYQGFFAASARGRITRVISGKEGAIAKVLHGAAVARALKQLRGR